MRLIGPVSHAIIDYAIVILLAAGPAFAGFTGPQAKYAYLFAAIMFIVALLTPWLIRFHLHGAIELPIAVLILILPWLANFSRGIHSRNFFVFVAILMISIWVMTDFRGMRRRAIDHADSGR